VKFAVYHPWVYLTSGLERTFLELFRRSRHEWVLYTHRFQPETTYPGFADFDVVELSPRVSVRRSFVPLFQAAATISRTRLPADGRSGLLVSSEGLGDFILARNATVAACYCHTPLKILHDEATRAALRTQSPTKYAALQALGPPFAMADRAMWRRYAHVFANSAETRRRIQQARLRAPDDVEVLEPGVDLDRITPGPSDRQRRLVLAGRIMWQKNIELAVDAMRTLGLDATDVQLVVAGAVDDKSKPYLDELRARATGLPIEFKPDPSDDELTDLYRTSTAALFTARNEDFGIVPLEAMAAGTPVLAVDNGGPRETVVDGRTGWLLPPTADAFAQQIGRVLDGSVDLAPMRVEARQRAEKFGWQRLVDRVDEVMPQLASAGQRRD
jgi:glycosyltransferase involved in cell wall biosynthesis